MESRFKNMEQDNTIEDYGQPESKRSMKIFDQVVDARDSYNPSER